MGFAIDCGPEGRRRYPDLCRHAQGKFSNRERERQPIFTIEEVFYDLKGPTVSSKPDIKWGFHQVKLDKKLHKITTFDTHRGLYRYK